MRNLPCSFRRVGCNSIVAADSKSNDARARRVREWPSNCQRHTEVNDIPRIQGIRERTASSPDSSCHLSESPKRGDGQCVPIKPLKLLGQGVGEGRGFTPTAFSAVSLPLDPFNQIDASTPACRRQANARTGCLRHRPKKRRRLPVRARARTQEPPGPGRSSRPPCRRRTTTSRRGST